MLKRPIMKFEFINSFFVSLDETLQTGIKTDFQKQVALKILSKFSIKMYKRNNLFKIPLQYAKTLNSNHFSQEILRQILGISQYNQTQRSVVCSRVHVPQAVQKSRQPSGTLTGPRQGILARQRQGGDVLGPRSTSCQAAYDC
jgi:hypothetical protein